MTTDKQKKKDQKQGEAAEGLRCSFCNKCQREVKKLIAGPKVFICDECVDICLDIIEEDRLQEQQLEQSQWSLPPPATAQPVELLARRAMRLPAAVAATR